MTDLDWHDDLLTVGIWCDDCGAYTPPAECRATTIGWRCDTCADRLRDRERTAINIDFVAAAGISFALWAVIAVLTFTGWHAIQALR